MRRKSIILRAIHILYPPLYWRCDAVDFFGDSSTVLFSVVGTAIRRDGTSVFVAEWKYGTQNPVRDYYLVKDGYFKATDLDTTSRNDIDKSINPFGEQRLAKSYPVDGDVWQHTLGDTTGDFWLTRSIGELNTFCGTFENVFGFTFLTHLDFPS